MSKLPPSEVSGLQLDMRVDQYASMPYAFQAVLDAYGPQYGFTTQHDVATYLLFNALNVPVFDGKGQPPRPVLWIPSTRIVDGRPGPQDHYRVAVVGKMPGQEESYQRRVLCGPSGQLLLNTAYEVGVGDEIANAYGTNVIRFYPPDGGKVLRPQHKKDCQWLLLQDLATVKPEFIICVGTDAVKAVFGKRFTMTKVRSHLFVMKSIYDLGTGRIHDANSVDTLDYASGIKLFATVHPAAVLREEGLRPGFKADISKLRDVLTGREAGNFVPGKACDYRYITDVETLRSTVDEVLDGGHKLISVDCEWGSGDHLSGKLRTVQFSWGPHKAACVIYRRQGLKDAVKPSVMYLFDQELKRLIHAQGMQVVGHNLRADALWLTGRGIDIMSRAYMDTMLVDHALNENAEHDLESVAVRYTDMGRYDWQLRKWLSDNGVGDKQLRRVGYRDIPDDLLHPYSCCDADAAYRIAMVLDRLLRLPANEMVARCYRDIIHPCMTPLHEMELNGVLADWERLVMLVRKYEQKKLELVERLRDDVGDPDFNFRSVPQVQKLLFGKRDEGGLGLTPLKTTGKPGKMWEDLLLEDDPSAVARASPSTDAESLEYLASETPIASKLRDVKIIDQVTKNFLRAPEVDFDTGVEVFHEGLVGQVDADGRVRTTFSQMSETGRQKSSDPNMQNLPSRQNDELDRIMGPGVPHIRSCFVSPEKTVMIEADYKSAELFTLGYLANCPTLVRDCASDIHARGAVTRMGAPKWSGFDEHAKPPDDWKTKYKHLRIASKTISFGIPYQRGAKAIAREIVKATHGRLMCDLIKAQRMVDGFYAQYPEVAAYVEMCKNSVLRGSLFNPYGRTRRFAVSDSLDQGTIAAMQREAVNFPIQSTVADTLNQAMYNLWYFRKLYPGLAEYKIILAVHDALFLEVPISSVRVVVEKALPLSMNHGATVPSWKPTGDYVATQPFNLDIDIEVMTRWGEKADKSELIAMGLDSDIADRYATST